MSNRAKKWEIKTRTELLTPTLDAIHDLSSEKIFISYYNIDRLYEQVSKILDKNNILGNNRIIYRAFMEELYKLTSMFKKNTLDKEALSIFAKYYFYGCDEKVLYQIGKIFNLELTIDRLGIAMKAISKLKEGTLIADGSEQIVLEYTGLARIMGYIDLQNMVDGDAVIIRQYIRLKKDGEFKKYAEETYYGFQPMPTVYIKPKESDYGIRITLQQTAGSYKSFDYNFLKEG